jgi:cytochrome b6
VIHLLLVQMQGMSTPPSLKKEAKKHRPMRFFPNFLLRDLFGWMLALALLATLAAFSPGELGEKADPFAPAYKDIKPEWYFMFMFETLKVMPGGEVLGIEYEAIPILLFGLGGLVLLFIPFIDRKATGGKGFAIAGVTTTAFVVGMTAWGYRSFLPLLIMLATFLVIVLFGYPLRKSRKKEE